jgi:hypothetical protein
VDLEKCAAAVRAVVGVAAPHHGTPLAQHFTSLFGGQLLKLLSLTTVYSLRTGRLPVGVALRLARLLRRKDSTPTGVVDQLFLQLLSDFAGKRRRAIEEFFSRVWSRSSLPARWSCSTPPPSIGPACATARWSRALAHPGCAPSPAPA